MTFKEWKATCTRVPNLSQFYGPTFEMQDGPGLVYGTNGSAGYINENPDGTYTLDLPMQELNSASASDLEPELYAFFAEMEGWTDEA